MMDLKELKNLASSRFSEIAQYYGATELKPTRDGFTCACPLHNGEDISHFSWKESYGCWSCYSDGCGVGQDVFSFIMKAEKCSFKEALSKAQELVGSGFILNYVPSEPKEPDPIIYLTQEDLDEVGFKELYHPYYKERGLTEETVKEFGLGYCSRGILAGRIAIPVHGKDGKLVGLTTRVLDNKRRPKYLHWGKTTSGDSFPTSRVLFNFHRAIKYSTTFPLLLVEGPFCAMRAYQYKKYEVAPLLGTNISKVQAHLIVSAYKRVVVGLDSNARNKYPIIANELMRAGNSLWVQELILPEDKDIDNMSRSEFWDLWNTTIWPKKYRK